MTKRKLSLGSDRLGEILSPASDKFAAWLTSGQKENGFYIYLYGIFTISLVSTLGLYFLGRVVFFEALGVPTMPLAFGDIRVLTGLNETLRLGLDPLVENPGDPWGRPFNQPRVWMIAAYLGLNQAHSIYIGFFLLALYLLSTTLIAKKLTRSATLFFLFAAFSPPAQLLLERGNNDLVILFLLTIGILSYQKHKFISFTLIFVSFFLKLFPIFAASIFLNLKPRKLLVYILPTAILILGFSYICWEDFKLIVSNTQYSMVLSFGARVVAWTIEAKLQKFGLVVDWLQPLAMFLAGIIFFLAYLHARQTELIKVREGFEIDSFRVGASLYMFTFIFGNNWDYRLIFLIFVIPQIVAWAASQPGLTRLLSQFALIAMVITLLSSLIVHLPSGFVRYVGYAFDEGSNWVLFVLMTQLFFRSSPPWVFFRGKMRCRSKVNLE